VTALAAKAVKAEQVIQTLVLEFRAAAAAELVTQLALLEQVVTRLSARAEMAARVRQILIAARQLHMLAVVVEVRGI
jgi:hypothetical protein